MSKKSDTAVLHRVTWPKPDLEPETEPKRLKSEPELGSEQETKLTSETYDPISEESDEDTMLEDLYGDLNSEDSDSSDETLHTKADVRYLEMSSKLSDYDAIPPPIHSYLCGGNPILPLRITKRHRPILKNLSEIALVHYQNQEGSGASFEFHDLVKCTFWSDDRRFRFPDLPNITKYYITFQAKGDPSNSPAITIFQAKVLVDKDDKDKLPVVEECRIKI